MPGSDYFSLARLSARLIFLAILGNMDRRRFEVSEAKLEKLELLQNRFISFHNLEKLSGNGKRRSVCMAGCSSSYARPQVRFPQHSATC